MFFPTGRQLWFDLAVRLKNKHIATPVAWLGDPVHDGPASMAFSFCTVLSFKSLNSGYEIPDFEYDACDDFFLDEGLYSRVKDKALKLLDRHDPYGVYRYLDKEVLFKECCAFALYFLKKEKPDFLLFAESPHSLVQYIFFEIAIFLKIKIFSFCSWSIAPVLVLRNGIAGNFVHKQELMPDYCDDKIDQKISAFIDRFRVPENDIEPAYMKRQRSADADLLRLYAKRMIKIVRQVRASVVSRQPDRLNRGLLTQSRLFVLEPVVSDILSSRIRSTIKKRLQESQQPVNLKARSYVYFPLHYEPERTTMPDGLEFFDQFKTLVVLRQLIPSCVPIFVKEHYSQFTSTLQGHKGRGFGFYSLLRRLPNVTLVPTEYSARDLIVNSDMTATITGTAALEAACLGIPALIFGNPWFRGAPGIVSYSRELSYATILREGCSTSQEIEIWLKKQFKCFGVFGCVNPSNESLFAELYTDAEQFDREVDGARALVEAALRQILPIEEVVHV